jgi:glyoxylase-like metal-dependent hydrolase (beta-lactamase superfamily II)
LISGYFFTNFSYLDRNNNIKFLKCSSLIIIHPYFGGIIFDTGSPDNPDDIKNQLKKYFGISADEIKWVFNTHIHPDHTGSNYLFKNANIIISRNDFLEAKSISEISLSDHDLKSYLYDHYKGYKNFYDDFEINNLKLYIKKYWNEERLGLNLKVSYIEDNPEIPDFIKIIPTFGHTLYHYSYKVENNNRDLYITGDAVSYRQILNEDYNSRLNEPHMDFNSYFKTVDILKKYNGIFVPGHDRPFYSDTKRSIKKNVFELSKL